jgi:hypothetical protein
VSNGRVDAEKEAQRSRLERARIAQIEPHRFKKGNPGKKKGTIDKRRMLGQEAAAALEGKCWDVLERLLSSTSWRARHEAVKTTLAYALGMPRQMLHIEGGFSDLSRELTAALVEARLRRAALDAALPVAALVTAPEAIPAAPAIEAPALEAEVVKAEGEAES